MSAEDDMAWPVGETVIKPDKATLLPCPFDGSTRIVIDRGEHSPGADVPDDDPDKWEYFGFCTTCAATGPWNKSSRERAITDWNRRAGSSDHEDFIKVARRQGSIP